jgi:single-strand DNA-binding protein
MSFRAPLDRPAPNPITWPRLRWGRKENQMNSLTLVGVLTKDPREVGGGERRGARMRLAEANAHPDHPLYIDASIFGPQAEACLEHLRKGSRVAVVGRLRFREWKRVDLSPRSEHWIAADRVDFLSAPQPVPDPAEAQASAAPDLAPDATGPSPAPA